MLSKSRHEFLGEYWLDLKSEVENSTSSIYNILYWSVALEQALLVSVALDFPGLHKKYPIWKTFSLDKIACGHGNSFLIP